MDAFLADFILRDAERIVHQTDLSPLKGKTVLLTGASGLIGHYVLASMKVAAEKGFAPQKIALVMKREQPDYFGLLCNGLSLEHYEGDITDVNFLSGLPSADVIIHAAGYGQPGRFMEDQIKTLKLNTISTFALLGKLNPQGKFLFLSSSEVYSGLENPPYRESQIGTTTPEHTRSCYIEGKRCGEAIVNAYRQRGVDAKSVRICLAYGPGTKKDDARALNSFIQKGIIQRVIALMDSGEAKRAYIYVTDAVRMMWDVLLYGLEGTYNVGGASRTTIVDLARLIAKTLGVSAQIPEGKGQAIAGAPADVFLNMEKMEKEFKKNQYVDIETGIANTVLWQKHLYVS